MAVMKNLKIDVEYIVREILKICKNKGATRCFVQIPEGLVHLAHDISKGLIDNGIVGIVSVDPCFGACDIPYWKAKILGCDLIVHVGHAPIPSLKIPMDVEFVELGYDIIVDEKSVDLLCAILKSRGLEKVGLITNVQYVGILTRFKDLLEAHGIRVYIGKASGRIRHDGQVLGCNISTARAVSKVVDGYIFVGDGMFHPIAVYLALGKPVLAYNPLTGEVKDVREEGEKILRIRMAHMLKASEAKSFGVIVTSKIGQYSDSLLNVAIEYLRNARREYSIIHLENVDETLNYIKGIDVFVIIGCPRIVYDDYMKFKRPVITVSELILSLKGKFEDWSFEELP
ncbi:MAG: diphthamide biosynthesis enzyme Dph2 [Euryarchaeota archaeon]|nr:diphthamide biosynthesis enzyme Dph2 [Euryarchaeota archaeon]